MTTETGIHFDDQDAELLAGYTWYIHHDGHVKYVYANVRHPDGYATTIKMHRLILGAGPGQQVDHIDGDGLNNRRSNLRIATPAQNQANQGKRRGEHTSKYKGVYWNVAKGRTPRWHVQIRIDGRRKSLGYFSDEDDAARAYDAAALEAHGQFAKLNFPEKPEGPHSGE